MKLSKTLKRFLIGSVILGALALVVTVAAPSIASAHGGRGDFSRSGVMTPGPQAGDQFLADALGITVEELQVAQQKANDAALAQAVEQGLLTQEQADAIKARDGRFPFAMIRQFGLKADIDMDALLADALGVTPDELTAARQTARDAALDQAVADGKLTQEQADQMKAAQALRDYLAQSDLQAQMRSLMEEKVNQAVQDGVITQEQADQFLQNEHGFGPFSFAGKPPFGAMGAMGDMGDMGGPGGMRGPGGMFNRFHGQHNHGFAPSGHPEQGFFHGSGFEQNSAPSALPNL